MIKISVVVPIYNAGIYLQVCIESILKQTLQEIEIICVDRGSSDGSVEVLEKYARMDPRILVRQHENGLASDAKNYGLQEAQGKYLVFLRTEDCIEPFMLEELYREAERAQADIGICAGFRYDEDTEEKTPIEDYLKMEFVPDKSSFSNKDIPKKIFNFTTSDVDNKIFKREFVLDNKLEFQKLTRADEISFMLLSLANAERICIVNKEMVGRSKNAGIRTLEDITEDSCLDFYNALCEAKKKLLDKEKFWELEQSFANYALGVCSYYLNASTSEKIYTQISTQLKEKILEEFRIIVHSQGYFYDKGLYNRMVELYVKKESDLFCQIQNQRKVETAKREHIKSKIEQAKLWKRKIELDNGIQLKVSVIIPIYNVEKYLKECIESVIGQTLKEIEIICIDDGSTDSSGMLADQYAQADQRLKVVHQKNAGLSAARNAGMGHAAGEYILFLDSDDYLVEYALERLYCEAKSEELDELFYCAKVFQDPSEDKQGELEYAGTYERFGDYSETTTGKEMFIKMVNNSEYKPSACLQLLKRSFLESKNICFKEGILHEDILFTSTCLAFAHKVKYFDENLYMRRLRYGSIMTSTKGIKNAFGYFTSIRELMRLSKKYKWQEQEEYFSALTKFMYILCDVGARFVSEISEKEIDDFLRGMNEEEIMLFKLLIPRINIIKKKTANNEKRATMLKYKAENIRTQKKLEGELQNVKDGTSYKIGSAITRIPQMAKAFVKR